MQWFTNLNTESQMFFGVKQKWITCNIVELKGQQQNSQPLQPQELPQAQEPREQAQDVGKSKLMAQQLGLLLHAQNCLKEEKKRKLRHVTMPHLVYKGQLISKCLFGVFNSPKKQTKTIRIEET